MNNDDLLIFSKDVSFTQPMYRLSFTFGPSPKSAAQARRRRRARLSPRKNRYVKSVPTRSHIVPLHDPMSLRDG